MPAVSEAKGMIIHRLRHLAFLKNSSEWADFFLLNLHDRMRPFLLHPLIPHPRPRPYLNTHMRPILLAARQRP